MLDGTTRLARTLLGIGAAFLLACCATTPEIASDFDRSAIFATCHTFALMQREFLTIPNPLVAHSRGGGNVLPVGRMRG